MENLEFIEYEEKYNDDLKRLSYEWLEKYALVEPEDVRILNNPKEIIINCSIELYDKMKSLA